MYFILKSNSELKTGSRNLAIEKRFTVLKIEGCCFFKEFINDFLGILLKERETYISDFRMSLTITLETGML